MNEGGGLIRLKKRLFKTNSCSQKKKELEFIKRKKSKPKKQKSMEYEIEKSKV